MEHFKVKAEHNLINLDLSIVREWMDAYQNLADNFIIASASMNVLNKLFRIYRKSFDIKLNKFRSKRKSNMYKLMR